MNNASKNLRRSPNCLMNKQLAVLGNNTLE